jgi:hypothetical protein
MNKQYKTKNADHYFTEANDHFRKASMHVADALIEAEKAGAALCRAKAQVKKKLGPDLWHIEVKKHFNGGHRNAQNYMRIHIKWKEIQKKVWAGEIVSINQALKELTRRRVKKAEPSSKLRNLLRKDPSDLTPTELRMVNSHCEAYLVKIITDSLKGFPQKYITLCFQNEQAVRDHLKKLYWLAATGFEGSRSARDRVDESWAS